MADGGVRRLDRHGLVTVDPRAWAAMLAARPDLADDGLVRDWAARRRPLIVRRMLPGDPPGHVPLGLPLPPPGARLGVSLPPDAIVRVDPPPALAAAAPAAPAAWRETIAALLAIDPRARCFGSLAWHHLTGLAYLRETSDLDLLWQVSTAAHADRLATAIDRVDRSGPVRIDGELVTAHGLAVQWREWLARATELLAKSADNVRLVARADVLR